MVTGFLFVIFYRNHLQRSSSKETLYAREVHRMVLGGLNVQILHQKNLLRRNEAKLFLILIYIFHVCEKFDLLWSVSNQGSHDPNVSTLTNRLQRPLRYPREIRNIYQKNIFPETSKIRRNSGFLEKTEIFVFRISKKSI